MTLVDWKDVGLIALTFAMVYSYHIDPVLCFVVVLLSMIYIYWYGKMCYMANLVSDPLINDRAIGLVDSIKAKFRRK